MKAADCPTNENLTAFVLGKLPEETLAKMARHTSDCPKCQSRLQNADQLSDPLISQLRQAPRTDALDSEPELARVLRRAVPDDTVSELRNLLAPPQADDEIGRLGAYRVLRLLGAGGMGLVMQAEDAKLHRLVALKVMKPEVAADPTARQRFLQEAKATAALRSDHVVTIYQVGEEDNVPFLAMEFLEGETLDSCVHRLLSEQQPARLPISEVLRIGREVAEGLAAAHERGLIHRDIKPANIWLEKPQGHGKPSVGGRVKLLDFGLARSLESDIHLTQTGHVLGTPSYMSPEQAHGKAVDPRADLFSLGTVLYELCTSVSPFRRETTFDTLMAVANDTPQPIVELNPHVPPAVADLVARLMAKKPEARPVTARAVADELRQLKRHLTQHTVQQSSMLGEPASPAAAGGRRLASVAVVALLLAALVAGGAYLVHSQKETKPPSAPVTEVAVGTAGSAHGLEVPPGPADDAFVRWVAGLSEEQRYSAVLQKLKELNPRSSRAATYNVAEKKIWFKSDGVTDLSPLRALPELRILHCHGSAKGKGTITDLSPIKDLKLTMLLCHWNQIKDLSPIKDMPLETLWCDYEPKRDLDVLQTMLQQKDTPRRINGKPAKQFLKDPVPPPAK